MRLLIGTSWKMNLTSTEASRYCRTLLPLVEDVDDRDLFVLPPFTAIWAVRQILAGSRIGWGAQDVHPEDAGAHTGDVSAPMLADLGCTYVEVGHSERRRDYGETDEWVAAQVSAIQRRGMKAIVCVGEQEPAPIGEVKKRLGRQLEAVATADPTRLVIAYEPAWAIGIGAAAAEPDWVGEVHGAIHDWIQSTLGSEAAVPVIYGGSVDSGTAHGILAQPWVNGLFVGRSALDPGEFARIAHIDEGSKTLQACEMPLSCESSQPSAETSRPVPDAELVESVRGLVRAESRAVAQVAPLLDESLLEEARLVVGAARVITTGVGTSGESARRMAHLLAVTGTPAHFLHPTDALHGALGGVRAGDVVICLSKGGRSQELNEFARRARKRGAHLIVVTTVGGSPLCETADFVSILPALNEGDPGGIVAMGSTLAASAWGDALVMVVMAMRGYELEEVLSTHPGGAVGLRATTPAARRSETADDPSADSRAEGGL